MVADVAQVGSSEQCVADGMNEHVGIAMAQQPQLMLYLDAPQPEVAIFHQLMDVVTHANSYSKRMILHNNKGNLNSPPLPSGGVGGGYYLLNKSLMPSMSNDRVKRSVWSSGLLFAVAMT